MMGEDWWYAGVHFAVADGVGRPSVTASLLRIENSSDAEDLLGAFKVLSEPRRFQIVRRLMRSELCVCEIIDDLGISQSLTSHHLGVLRRAGLIGSRRSGPWVYYSVNAEKLRVLNRAFADLFDPASLPPEAMFGASSSCGGVERDPSAGPCCARHEHSAAQPIAAPGTRNGVAPA
jgi:ArsR family transcriptional regulator, arsenate/arsenite/antimonite-responsive transcriptional repressor